MDSKYVQMELDNPEISLADKKQILLVEFLVRARELCPGITVKDLESFLPAFGIPLNEHEHFILVMTDHEILEEQGIDKEFKQLIADYSCWKKEIEDSIRFRNLVRENHRLVASPSSICPTPFPHVGGEGTKS